MLLYFSSDLCSSICVKWHHSSWHINVETSRRYFELVHRRKSETKVHMLLTRFASSWASTAWPATCPRLSLNLPFVSWTTSLLPQWLAAPVRMPSWRSRSAKATRCQQGGRRRGSLGSLLTPGSHCMKSLDNRDVRDVNDTMKAWVAPVDRPTRSRQSSQQGQLLL